MYVGVCYTLMNCRQGGGVDEINIWCMWGFEKLVATFGPNK